jgi:hypothetical protein
MLTDLCVLQVLMKETVLELKSDCLIQLSFLRAKSCLEGFHALFALGVENLLIDVTFEFLFVSIDIRELFCAFCRHLL